MKIKILLLALVAGFLISLCSIYLLAKPEIKDYFFNTVISQAAKSDVLLNFDEPSVGIVSALKADAVEIRSARNPGLFLTLNNFWLRPVVIESLINTELRGKTGFEVFSGKAKANLNFVQEPRALLVNDFVAEKLDLSLIPQLRLLGLSGGSANFSLSGLVLSETQNPVLGRLLFNAYDVFKPAKTAIPAALLKLPFSLSLPAFKLSNLAVEARSGANSGEIVIPKFILDSDLISINAVVTYNLVTKRLSRLSAKVDLSERGLAEFGPIVGLLAGSKLAAEDRSSFVLSYSKYQGGVPVFNFAAQDNSAR